MPLRDTAPVGAPCWIDLMTSDKDASRAFYGELFGWTSEDAGEEYGHYVNFSRDGVQIAGCMDKQPDSPIPDIWSVYLATADADATVAAIGPLGGQTMFPVMDVMDLGRMSMLLDPGGAAIGIWQPGLHKGFGVLGEPGAPGWFELHTRSYDDSIAFYREVFGWDLHTMGDTPEFRYSTFGEGDDALAGIMDATGHLPEGVPAHWAIYFSIEDTDATVKQVGELGGSVVEDPQDTPYGRLAVVADATGASFRLMGPNVG
jgi:predicted enzyme related to lactoylglutathione lyase